MNTLVVLFIAFVRSSHPAVSFLRLAFRPDQITLRAFFLTDFNSRRVDALWNYIKSHHVPDNIDFDYYFVNWTRDNNSERRSLYPPEEYRKMMSLRPRNYTWGTPDKDPDLAAKFWFSLRFFLQNTSARWFYRATDDTIINFAKLGGFFADLERRSDPLWDFVFYANCVRNIPWTFPQGGSGYLLSRAAVEYIEPMGRTFMSTMMQPEDVAYQPFLQSLGITMRSITNPFFCGHNFGYPNLMKIRNGQWSAFPACPPMETRPDNYCRPFFAPIRDIVFYHEWQGGFHESLQNSEAVFRADPRIHWYIDEMHPQLCSMSSERMGKYL